MVSFGKINLSNEPKINPLFISQIFSEKFKSVVLLQGDQCQIKEIAEEELTHLCDNFSQSIKPLNLTRVDKEVSSSTEVIPPQEEDSHRSVLNNESENRLIIVPFSQIRNPEVENKSMRILSDENSAIQLPENYTTNDLDLKQLCDLINEPPIKEKNGWAQVINESNISIFKKSIPSCPTVLIKTIAMLEGFNKDEVFEAISDIEIRRNWDTVFSDFRIVDVDPSDGNWIVYTRVTPPSIWISDRDFVQKRKIWRNFPTDESNLLHYKSVINDKCPVVKNAVRADTKISGYYMKTVSFDPLKTFLIMITQTDIKGSIPSWVVNIVAQKAPRRWVMNLIKGCEKVKSSKK